MGKRSQRMSRRILGCVLAYALAVQGLILAFSGGTVSYPDQTPVFAGFTLCHHDGTASPNAPAQAPACDHCPFCFAGAIYLNCTPPWAPHRSALVVSDAAWPLAAPHLAAFFINASAWPRGPPAAA